MSYLERRLFVVRRALITKAGQMSLPATIRRRWNTRAVVIDDRGDHVVIRPVPPDPIGAIRGRFAGRGSSEDARRLARAEERRLEEVRASRLSGSSKPA